MPTEGSRVVHVLAAEAGLQTAEELVPALRAGGRLVHEQLAQTRDAMDRISEQVVIQVYEVRP